MAHPIEAVVSVWGIYIVGSFVTLLAWMGNRQIKRIDEIEHRLNKAVGRDELTTVVQGFRDDVKEIRTEISSGFTRVNERIDSRMDKK